MLYDCAWRPLLCGLCALCVASISVPFDLVGVEELTRIFPLEQLVL